MTAVAHDLDGQWAVVTGGSKGIGLGIARALLDGGANVVLVARGAGDLEQAAGELRAVAAGGQQVLTMTADTGDPSSLDHLFDRLESELPSLTPSPVIGPPLM